MPVIKTMCCVCERIFHERENKEDAVSHGICPSPLCIQTFEEWSETADATPESLAALYKSKASDPQLSLAFFKAGDS